jgi:hypothetical protein
MHRSRAAATPHLRRFGVLIPLAITCLLLLPALTTAGPAPWGTHISLTSSGRGVARDLVVLGQSTAIVAFQQGGAIWVRRSADSGITWDPATRIARSGEIPAIAGYGRHVDVAWLHGGVVRYATSTNGGASFGAPVALSDPVADDVSVARAGARVVIVWRADWDEVVARTSEDGGATFGDPNRVAHSEAWNADATAVAVADGVIYIAYLPDIVGSKVRVRRSLDGGATWSRPARIGENFPIGSMTIVAEGSEVYVGYAERDRYNVWTAIKRSGDAGVTWDRRVDLSAPTANPSFTPVLNVHHGVVRAAFERCMDRTCVYSAIFFRRSTNGYDWTAEERVTPGPGDRAVAGVGFVGRNIVAYSVNSDAGIDVAVGLRH